MTIRIDTSVTANLDECLRREWLEANGLGGWASSTLAGAHTRRYHGILVAATQPPVGRMVLLSKLEETLVAGDEKHELGCNRYPGVVHPEGYRSLESFTQDLFPVFEYAALGVKLRKTIVAPHGENTTVVLYEVLSSPSPVTLDLRPFMAPRGSHELSRVNQFLDPRAAFEGDVLRIQAYPGIPQVFVQAPGARFTPAPDWYRNFEYDVERERGLDFREDLFTHGVLSLEMREGDELAVIVSTTDPTGRDGKLLVEQERRRREDLLRGVRPEDDFQRALRLAADSFIVRRGDDLRTIIAGYHWFADWGRDAMIALPGLCLVTGRFDDAKKILRTFARSVSEGMLPNRFPDAGEEPEYNTVDATLWFFVAIHRYLEATGDEAFVLGEMLPVLLDIVAWHDRGTRHGIRTDQDGLLRAGAPGVQLTWMDAKVGDHVITPREGKAVEINALWYNAIAILADLTKRGGDAKRARALSARAKAIRSRFQEVFWNETLGCLDDVVDGDRRDSSVRPNQLLALSLPFALLPKDKARRVLAVVDEKLLTPVGLRSLAPDDPAYHPRHTGHPGARDAGYHQGTVWSWLLGPYATALVRAYGAAGKRRARALLEGLRPHLADAGIGTVSEIFDADPPHEPRGCIAQAWSVAETLRAWVEEIAVAAPRRPVSETAKRAKHSVGRPVLRQERASAQRRSQES
jgi:predicted glycogen debranching enzyme